MEHDPEGHERLQAHKRSRDVVLEVEANPAPVARENEGDPAPLERHVVEEEAPVESASVKRGPDACLRIRAEGKRGQKHNLQDVLEPQAKTKARLEPRRGQKRESTQPLPELEVEVTSIIQGGSTSSADVRVNSSVAASVSVEDMVQTSDPISTSVGIQPDSSGTVGPLSFDESKARYFEKLTEHGIGAGSRENPAWRCVQ